MYTRTVLLVRRGLSPGRSIATLRAVVDRGRSRIHYVVGAGIISVGIACLVSPTQAKAIADTPDKRIVHGNSPQFMRDVAEVLSESQIEIDAEELKQRGKPWNSYHKSDFYPALILYPESTEQVSSVVKVCNKHKVPLVPFGGGTSLEGQTVSTASGGVSLDFNRMKRVIELNEDDLDVRVEAGIGYVELNEKLKSKGLWFPLDPGPGASIGGAHFLD
jgi:hypothetical protein